jgi:tRNA G18 (ribose-2'-O)-methylase SpoU
MPEMKTPDHIPPVTARDGRFQQWQALLTNRNKRERSGEFLVQGVRPISLAVRHGWTVSTLLHDASRSPSDWARGILDAAGSATRVAVAPALLQELGGKEEGIPELLAVVRRPPDRLERIPLGDGFLGVLFDRPMSPGNIGTLVRSADAFGATGVIITGHAADPYDPKAIRASTGSLFALPLVRAPSHREVLEWLAGAAGVVSSGVQIVGTDEKGDVDAAAHDFRRPTLILVGSEKRGLSLAWRAACDKVVRIPMAAGAASSLNAATSAAVVLYEVFRQRSA